MSAANDFEDTVHPFPVPNPEIMRQHLEHLFGGGYLDGLQDGLIELAWTDTYPDKETGKYKLRHAQLYGTDDFDSLIEMAVTQNRKKMCNVYIGAALRRPDTAPFGRANRKDYYGLTCAYADLDEKEAVTKAKERYGEAKPTLVVLTGREPHTRAQIWWRLVEPIIDPDVSEALLRGIASVMKGDEVYDGPRVMRLAGSVAWPHKPGRIAEGTVIKPLGNPGAREYDVEYLAKRFPPIKESPRDHGINTGESGETRSKNAFGHDDKIDDGRHMYIWRTAEAVMIQLIGELGRCPTGQELFDAVWPQYQENANVINSEGKIKGKEYVAAKCSETVTRFQQGKIRGCETIETAKLIYARKRASGRYRQKTDNAGQSRDYSTEFEKDPETGEPKALIVHGKDFIAGYKPPPYVINGLLQKGYAYCLTGPAGHGKTPVSMYAAAAVSLGKECQGRKTRQGSVLFLAGENVDDIRARYIAMADHDGFNPNTTPFYFVCGVIDIKGEMARIKAEAVKIGDLSMIVVDTDQAYFQGEEGNSNEQRKWFAKELRELTQLPDNPCVLVNCHPVKNASKDNLVPIGGSSFMNELDGNIMCWADDRTTTLRQHPAKWRGAPFEAMVFELKTFNSPKLLDENGDYMPSVVAVPISDDAAQRRSDVAGEDDKQVLRLLHADKKASMTSIAKAAGWSWPDGSPAKSKVQRIIDRLFRAKMIYEFHNGKYKLSKKGCRLIGVPLQGDNDEE